MLAVPSPVAQAAKKNPHAPALISPGRFIDFATFDDQVRRAVSALSKNGVKAHTRVALKLPNSPEYAILIFALLRVGAIACPVNTRWPAEYVNPYLEKIQANMLICGADEKTGHRKLNIFPLDEIFTKYNWPPAKTDASLWLDRHATILSTSGTIAEPKAVLHSLGNHYYSALASNHNLPFGLGDRWLLSLPLCHVGGLAILFRAVLGGGAAVFQDPGETMAQTIQRHGITHLSLVTLQAERLLKETGRQGSLSTLKAILWGGGPIPRNLLALALARKLPVFPTYGMTETASQAATVAPSDPKNRKLTCGKQLKFNMLRISNEGEIEVRGECCFLGYVDSGGISVPHDGDGWFKTGDLGSLDAKGYLTVSGRKDNLFISGGENIHPEPIESLLRGFPGVLEALVVPVPHRQFGSRPAAFIKTDRHPLPLNEIKEFLIARLPKFMVPDHFFDWPSNLAVGEGKPPRAQLRNLALAFTARFV